MANDAFRTLSEAALLDLLPEQELVERARGSLDAVGYPTGLASRSPFEVLLAFFRDYAKPRLEQSRQLFLETFRQARRKLEQELENLVQQTDDAATAAHGYIEECAAEGFAGPKIATLVIVCAVAEALRKVLAGPSDPLAALGPQDWLMLAFFYLRFFKPTPQGD